MKVSAEAISASIKTHHKTLTLVLATCGMGLFALTAVFATLPPKIQLESSPLQRLDQPITAVVLGVPSLTRVEVKINPKSSVNLTKIKNLNPFLKQVKIAPDDLLHPSTDYSVEITAKNWLGFTNTKVVSFRTYSLPKVLSDNTSLFQEVPAKAVIVFELDTNLSGGNFTVTSTPQFEYNLKTIENKVLVNPSQGLEQGAEYQVSLNFGSKAFSSKSIYETSFSVVDPLELVSSTPANTAAVVSKQSILNFTFNKPLKKDIFEKLFSLTPTIEGSFQWKDEKSVEFIPSTQLLTGTNYSATFPQILEALDGSYLGKETVVNFTTAGNVKVLSISPSEGYASLNSSIEVTFDQGVDQTSAQQAFSVTPALAGSFGWNGNSLIFKPSNLTPLTAYKVVVASGIKSLGGEDSNQEFSGGFTATGERVRVIGRSVSGRSISAYYFGTGVKKILLVGTLHGSESNTGSMLSSWISFLRSNQKQIPADRTFIIIPYANPDGRAANNRFNTHGVDLNRNWGTPDWQALTYWKSSSYPNGGGAGPFSEPETAALRDLILTENPAFSISYHSAANLVIGDGVANSFGDWYASLTGYTRSHSDEEDSGSCLSAVGYCITGTMEEWMSLRGLPVIVVEFISATSSEYSRNLPALKGLLNYSL